MGEYKTLLIEKGYSLNEIGINGIAFDLYNEYTMPLLKEKKKTKNNEKKIADLPSFSKIRDDINSANIIKKIVDLFSYIGIKNYNPIAKRNIFHVFTYIYYLSKMRCLIFLSLFCLLQYS